MSSKLPSTYEIRNFSFSEDQKVFCHQRLWYKYPEDQYFRLLKIRTGIEELWEEIEAAFFPPTAVLSLMPDFNQEIYVLASPVITIAIMIQDHARSDMAGRMILNRLTSMDDAIRKIHWYRRRAREKGNVVMDHGLRSLMKFLMNLPGDPSFIIRPDIASRLAIQVHWPETHGPESVTLTIADPTNNPL